MGDCTGGCPGGGNYSSAKLEGKQWQAATRTPLYLHTFHLHVNFTKLGNVQRPSEAVQLVLTVVIENHLLQLLSRPTHSSCTDRPSSSSAVLHCCHYSVLASRTTRGCSHLQYIHLQSVNIMKLLIKCLCASINGPTGSYWDCGTLLIPTSPPLLHSGWTQTLRKKRQLVKLWMHRTETIFFLYWTVLWYCTIALHQLLPALDVEVSRGKQIHSVWRTPSPSPGSGEGKLRPKNFHILGGFLSHNLTLYQWSQHSLP